MAYCEHRLILASGSPRRRELLERFGLPFEVIPSCGEEEPPRGEAPGAYVELLARQKAAEVAARVGDTEAVYIAADTIVESEGVILGKPGDGERAFAMLSALSGRTHRVWSGICVRQGEKVMSCAECTEVHFRELSEAEIRQYIRTGEPLDKAGAYGYQGLASLFVDSIRGDYFNVVGLPLCTLGQLLKEFGIGLL